ILAQTQDGREVVTPRLRPLPGSQVKKLDAERTLAFIELPQLDHHEDGTTNAVGCLLNADGVPLCIDARKFNYHVMVSGGTGSGKSNVAANLVDQAARYGKCVLIHDAKPDYRLIDRENSDTRVRGVWERFEDWHLHPQAATDVRRIGFHRRCEPDAVDEVLGSCCSDFYPEMLAGLFFTESGPVEQNSYDAFAGAAQALDQRVRSGDLPAYNLDQILAEVQRRFDPSQNVPFE